MTMLELNHRMFRAAAVAVCALIALSGTAVEAGFEETKTFSGGQLTVRNLIGEIEVVGHSGSQFEVQVKVQGSDATAKSVQLESTGSELEVRFPLSESRHYVYPRLGKGETRFNTDGDSWLGSLLGGRDVRVSGSGSGLEIWADITIRVPAGAELEVDHGVGEIQARNLDGAVVLGTHSGAVEVDGASGELIVDTGSGHVTVRNVEGDVNVDTGSGHVVVESAHGEKITVDTGSGHVELNDVDARDISVDTGSGGVEGAQISADELTVDTGSGSVELSFVRMGRGDFEVDTGSGGIRLELPPDASAVVTASTGSGGIRIDGGDVRHMERDEAKVVFGGGDARMNLDTGSGGIRIVTR